MFAGRILLVALVAAVAANCGVKCSALIEEESQKLAESISEMEQVYESTMRQIFWSNKMQAEYLMHKGRQEEAKELLNTAQTAAFIESIKYAVRHKSLSMVREAIGKRFVASGIMLRDRKLNINMRPEMLAALVSRLVLRGYADADRFTVFHWGLLYKIIEHNLAAFPANREMRILAINAYQQLLQLSMASKRALTDFERVLDSSLAAMEIDKLQGGHIVALLDQLIEDLLECQTCAGAPADPTRLNMRPMFDGESGVKTAVAEHVSAEIQSAFVELEGVFDVSVEEQERVTRQDIETLMQRLIDSP